MRIIENPNPSPEIRGICDNCKCEFAYNSSDIHSESWNNGILGPGFYGYSKSYVICPNCATRIDIVETESNSSYLPDDLNFFPIGI